MSMPTPYFQDEWSTIYLGNSLEIAPLLTAIDAVISDPPYGMNWDTDTTRFSGGAQKVSRGKDWGCGIIGDSQPFNPEPWIKFKHVVLWGSNHYANRLPVGTTLVWAKRNDWAFESFLSDGEIAWMKSGHGVYLFRMVPSFNSRGLHPTQKPIELMSWCIEMAKVSTCSTILDPYMGSGTTLVAAKLRGIKAIGIEIEERYVKIAVERLRQGVLIPC